MKMRVYYFGVLFALFAPLGALCEPGGRFAIDTLKEDLLAIKQLVGLAVATPALDAVVVGAVEPGIEEIQAALEDAEACLVQAVQNIAQEELAQYAEKLEVYWLQLLDATRSRKNKNFCRLFAQVACINRLKARTVDVTGTLTAQTVDVTGTLTAQRLEVDEFIIDPAVFASLLVNGDATITGNLTVGGNEALAGDLSVGGSETIAVNLSVGGNGAVAGDFAVGDDLAVTDDGSFGGDVAIGGNLNLPNTTTTVGMFSKAGTQFLHNFGTDNTFLGFGAGNTTLTTADSNVGIGTLALPSLTTGDSNVAVGANAGLAIDSGTLNTAIGASALQSNTSGAQNVAVGATALVANATGSTNVAVGTAAFSALNASAGNTAVGHNAGLGLATLTNVTLVGLGTTATNGATNSAAFGNGAVSIGNNDIVLGNASIATLRCNAALSPLSDERTKRDIKRCPLGLQFVKTLDPIAYEKSATGEAPLRELGFSAQAVERAARACGNEFPGVICMGDTYYLRYNDLFAPMVKAIQELSATVDRLEQQIAELKKAH